MGAGRSGVRSIHLISRSSCAFVNYDTQHNLQVGTACFNGMPLRPTDSRCPPLVCRIRGKDDDLRAGVGGQRGIGLHKQWVKANAPSPNDEIRPADEPGEGSSTLSSGEGDTPARPPLPPHGSNSSGSVSTTSSFLSRHFPQRFFILKSLTQVPLLPGSSRCADNPFVFVCV